MDVKAISKARATVQAIAETLEDLHAYGDRLNRELHSLENQPHYTHARLFYRASNKKKGGQQYAYVAVHPPGGERTRLYIGLMKEKIDAAETAIAKGVRILSLRKELARIETETTVLERELNASASRVRHILNPPVYRHAWNAGNDEER